MPQEVPYFVKANKVDLPTDINPLWSDAENLLFLQPPLGINSACGQGSGDGGRHSHGEEEEGHSHYFCHRLLQAARATGGEVGATAPPATEQRTPSSDHGFILLLSVLSLHAHTSSSSRLDRRSRRYSSGLGAGAQPGSTACTYLVVREHTHSIYQSQHADGGEAYDELEGISVELEVHGLGVEDGSHQVTFSSVEPCVKTRALHHLSDKVVAWQASSLRNRWHHTGLSHQVAVRTAWVWRSHKSYKETPALPSVSWEAIFPNLVKKQRTYQFAAPRLSLALCQSASPE